MPNRLCRPAADPRLLPRGQCRHAVTACCAPRSCREPSARPPAAALAPCAVGDEDAAARPRAHHLRGDVHRRAAGRLALDRAALPRPCDLGRDGRGRQLAVDAARRAAPVRPPLAGGDGDDAAAAAAVRGAADAGGGDHRRQRRPHRRVGTHGGRLPPARGATGLGDAVAAGRRRDRPCLGAGAGAGGDRTAAQTDPLRRQRHALVRGRGGRGGLPAAGVPVHRAARRGDVCHRRRRHRVAAALRDPAGRRARRLDHRPRRRCDPRRGAGRGRSRPSRRRWSAGWAC